MSGLIGLGSQWRVYQLDGRHNWASFEEPGGGDEPALDPAVAYQTLRGQSLSYDEGGFLQSDAEEPGFFSSLVDGVAFGAGAGFDALAGFGNGLGIPFLDDGPAFGHSNFYHGGQIAGASAGLAVDAALIVGGATLEGGGAVCTFVTAGACAPMGVPAAAGGAGLMGLGGAGSMLHMSKLDDALDNLGSSRSPGMGTRGCP